MFRQLLPASALAISLFAATSAAAEVQLLTSIKPLQLIAAAVQEGVGEADVLLPPGASAHDYYLRPSDIRRLRDAQLFYWVGPDMESFLAHPLERRQQPTLAVQSLPGLTLRHFGEDHADEHEHDDHAAHDHAEETHGHADDHADHGHREGSLDAHLWLLPANARQIAQRMTEDLASADPANAARYRDNFAAFEQRLTALDQRLQARLGMLADKPYFVAHDAYGYFEQAYGLEHSGVFSLGGEVQPGARHVAALREQLKAAGPSCVFSEPPLRPRLVDSLSKGLPVKMAVLDPLGSDIKAGPHGYERLLEDLADELAGCLESL